MSVDRETLDRIRTMVAGGGAIEGIANALGMMRYTVRRLVRQHQLGSWCSPNAAQLPIPDTFAADHAAMSFTELAEHYGRSKSTVENWAKRLGLKKTIGRRAKAREASVKVSVARPISAEPIPFVRKDAHMLAMPRSLLPEAPCFRCGARGFCGHDGRVDERRAA